MFNSMRRCNKFTSLLVAFIPTHLPWSILSSEAFLLSSWRSHKLLCNDNQIRSLTRCSLSDVESYAEISQNIRECYNEKETDGVIVGKKEDNLGIRGSDTHSIMFTDVKVPKENRIGENGFGFSFAMKTLSI